MESDDLAALSLFFLLLPVLLASCAPAAYTRKADSVAFVGPREVGGPPALRFKYSVELKIHGRIGGTRHDGFDWFRVEKDDSSIWLFTNSIQGRVEADALLMEYDGKGDPKQVQTDLKGSIVFDAKSLRIDLQTPIYLSDFEGGNTPHHWVPFEFNGKYRAKTPPGVSP